MPKTGLAEITNCSRGAEMRTLRSSYLAAVLLSFCYINVGLSESYPVGGVFIDDFENAAHLSPPIDLARQYDDFCDNSAGLPPIGNQGNQLSCTCWASGYYLKTYHEGQERGWDLTVPEHQCSPAFLYNQLNGGEHGGVWMIDIFNKSFKVLCALLSRFH